MEHAKSEHRILPQKVDGENRAHHMTTDGNDGSFRMQMVKEDTIMKTVGRGCTVAAIHAGITCSRVLHRTMAAAAAGS